MFSNRKITVPLKKANHNICFGYTYLVPIKKNYVNDKYVGLSIEEIKQKYGDDDVKYVDAIAALGLGDITKPNISIGNPTCVECVDVHITQKMNKDDVILSIELVHNDYTHKSENKNIHKSIISILGLEQDPDCLNIIISKILDSLGDIDTDKINKVHQDIRRRDY